MSELNPQQLDFLRFYDDPTSETFGNAYASAKRANYSDEYSKVIASRQLEWVSENVKRRERLLNKAEKKLETLIDSADDRIAADMAKHITKTLGKDHYSEKQEVEHSGNLTINSIAYADNNTAPIQAKELPTSTS